MIENDKELRLSNRGTRSRRGSGERGVTHHGFPREVSEQAPQGSSRSQSTFQSLTSLDVHKSFVE